jgi:hypothetical protein
LEIPRSRDFHTSTAATTATSTHEVNPPKEERRTRQQARLDTFIIRPIERVIRGIVGLGMLSLVVLRPRSLWGLLGLIPLATAVFDWCPPYALLGISTCPKRAVN